MTEKVEKKVTKGDLMRAFVYENFQQASFNFERMHGLAFCVDMIPAIKRLYADDRQEAIEALRRHNQFFNVTPAVCGVPLGVTIGLEEARANGKGIDAKTIQSLKVGLMGPLCGVGDPLIWGTLRPIAAALGAALAVTGNPLGPILFFVLFNVVRLAVKWLGLSYGYKAGLGIVRDLSGNVLPKLTEGATVLGLFVMGVLITKWTTINIPLIVSSTVANGVTTTTTVQNILDELCPGLLGLGLTLLSMRLLKNRVSPIILIFILFAVGIAGYGLGLLA
jgi:PTS system, mannose/fructose/sorbose family, IID component